MRTLKLLTTLCLILGFTGFAKAQTTTADLVKEWERAKTYTKEYLDAMTETGYALKPTPEMRSFAEQMLHLSDGNFGFASGASGEKSPYAPGALEKSTDKSKAAVTKAVMESYDFTINALKKLTPQQLDEQVKIFGSMELTRRMAFIKAFEHQTHHRGQATVYLRLAGVKPPQEKLF